MFIERLKKAFKIKDFGYRVTHHGYSLIGLLKSIKLLNDNVH